MLQVLYDNQSVGCLWSEARELYFPYDPLWLQASAAFALTPQLSTAPTPTHLYHLSLSEDSLGSTQTSPTYPSTPTAWRAAFISCRRTR